MSDLPTYCLRVAAADERHRVRVTCAKSECATAQTAALTTYRQLDPVGACNVENATYRKAVADADRECARGVAESGRIRDSEIDAAFAEHRAGPEYLGAAR